MKVSSIMTIIVSITLAVSGCSSDDGGNGVGPTDGLQTQQVSGKVDIPSESPLTVTDLQVGSALGDGAVGGSAAYTVNTPVTGKHQLLAARTGSGKTVLLGYLAPGATGVPDLSARSTAKALILMNPFFIRTSSTQKTDILNRLESQTRASLDQLEGYIKDLLINDPQEALNYTKHPRIFEEAAKIAIVILKGYGTNTGVTPTGAKPLIVDAPADSIAFKNPTSIYYAAGVYERGSTTLKDVYLIESQSDLSSIQLGWPPKLTVDSTRTPCKIGNGAFDVKVTRGFDFSSGSDFSLDWSKPTGRANLANTGKAILELIDQAVGYKFDVAFDKLSLNVTSQQAGKLQDGMRQQDGWKMTNVMTEIIVDNKDQISTWLWGEASSTASKDFMDRTQQILKSVADVVKIVGAGEADLGKAAPFFYDLTTSSPETKYAITQNQGILTENTENEPPDAPVITDGPEFGNVGTPYTFTVLADDDDDTVSFRFHWGDGQTSNWTPYVPVNIPYSYAYTYSVAGTFYITAEARDLYGSISSPSDEHEILIAPFGSSLYDDFDADPPGGHPSDPPWSVAWIDPSYVRISEEVRYGYSGNSCGFHDYDPAIADSSDTAYAQIYAETEEAITGTLEFAWWVETADDDFGVRCWGGSSWDDLGYYVLFKDSELLYSYWDAGSNSQVYATIMSASTSTWYRMKLEFDCNQGTYDIYVNGTLRVSDAPFYGTPASLYFLQMVAFSDNVCRAAYVDNVNLSITLGGEDAPAIIFEPVNLSTRMNQVVAAEK